MKEIDHRPDPAQLLAQLGGGGRRRALSRAYLGYARGVGATSAMLDEARRRASRGTDVLVAAYQIHGDATTVLEGMDVMGGGRHRPQKLRLDLDAVLARNPEVVCVDDLAEPDASGVEVLSLVPELLAAGMTVLGTLHVLSVRSSAETLGSVATRRPELMLVDDEALALIDELELVDITPRDLLVRLRLSPVLSPAERALALQRELRPAVLDALRESAFRMIAEHEDPKLLGYLREAKQVGSREVRGRIVLCLQARPGMEDRLRRIARYAEVHDAKLSVVTVRTRPMSTREQSWLGSYATLTHQLGGEFVRLRSRRVAPAIVAYVRQALATEVVLGHRRHRWWWPGDTTSDIIRQLSGVDVHILREDR